MTSLEMAKLSSENDNTKSAEMDSENINENSHHHQDQLVIWPAVNARGSSLRLVRNPLPVTPTDD